MVMTREGGQKTGTSIGVSLYNLRVLSDRYSLVDRLCKGLKLYQYSLPSAVAK